jgi:hypothetical protein
MYIAMWNMPGCLPEMEPAEFGTFEHARDFIVDELGRVVDNLLVQDCPLTAQGVEIAIEELRGFTGPFSVVPDAHDGYVYSVDKVQS